MKINNFFKTSILAGLVCISNLSYAKDYTPQEIQTFEQHIKEFQQTADVGSDTNDGMIIQKNGKVVLLDGKKNVCYIRARNGACNKSGFVPYQHWQKIENIAPADCTPLLSECGNYLLQRTLSSLKL